MNQWSLLYSRQLLPLFITQFLGACNDNIFKNALIIFIVFRLAESLALNAQLLVALASGLFILPFFLFSITAGQLADKYQKSQLILRVKFIEVLLMPCAALGFYLQHISLLMTVLFLLGIQATFFGPLKYSILPELLAKEDLLKGNGLIEAATFIAILIGTILGGLLILHPYGKSIISGIIMVVALLGWLSAWFIPLTPRTHLNHPVNFKIVQEMRALFQYAYVRKDVFLSIGGISWFWLFGSTILSVLPPFTKTVLHGDASVITFFMAIFSIGIAAGSLICTLMSKTKIYRHVIYLSLFGLALCTADIGLSEHTYEAGSSSTLIDLTQFLSMPSSYRVVLDAWGLSMFGGLYTVPLYTLLQSRTPATHRARVVAFNNIVNALFMIFSALSIMGLISLGCSEAQILLLLAAGTGIVTLVLYHQRNQIG